MGPSGACFTKMGSTLFGRKWTRIDPPGNVEVEPIKPLQGGTTLRAGSGSPKPDFVGSCRL